MAEIISSTFVLSVTNLDASVRFYTEQLGFHEDLRVEGWSFLRRGACLVRIGDCPGSVPMLETPDHSWFAYLHVHDAAELYQELLAKGVEIWHPLRNTPWGMREFAIVTPDGHRIMFGERMVSNV